MKTEYQSVIEKIQPVVLVGGQSSRFGRDKLVEQVDGELLVSRPINALRGVFGNRVGIVGKCDQKIMEIADLVIDDPYPGLGPIGGICAALESSSLDIFVCAGDLLAVNEAAIGAIIQASIDTPEALVYIALDGRRHPAFGLYRNACVPFFQRAIAQGKLKLGMVLDQESIVCVQVDSDSMRNINRREDLTG